jgi:hypothetical protein
MQLQKELLPNFKTANEEKLEENIHTAPTYSFAAYCEAEENKKTKKYFDEEFNLDECRNDIFGEDNGCEQCSGTGWMPVSKANMKEPLHSLWAQAEEHTSATDGWHIVPCPKCSPINDGELDEHIVKTGSEFELKSKKSGKNLGKYKSKAGAEKREKQVEYFKHMKEDAILPGFPDHAKTKTQDVNEELPSQHNAKQSQAKKDEKKNPNADKSTQSPDDKKRKEVEKRKEKESDRKSKKLLPYEFTDQKDAERSAGHLGMHGAHGTGNGIYKPGSSEYSLRDAVARKKDKQRQRGVKEGVNTNDAYPLEKSNCHEDRDYMHSEDPKDSDKMAECVLQKIKECVIFRQQ